MKTKYVEEEQTGENGLQPTTWAFCWRCGKRIVHTHNNEVCKGVHWYCETIHLAYYDNTGKLEVILGA